MLDRLTCAGHAAVYRYPKVADDYTVPIGSGFIAGESLMGVAIIMLTKVAGISLAL